MENESKLTTQEVHKIGEELRTTRYEGTEEMAFGYIFHKYKDKLRNNVDFFIKLMEIEALFFSCKENVEEIRRNTIYTYVPKRKEYEI